MIAEHLACHLIGRIKKNNGKGMSRLGNTVFLWATNEVKNFRQRSLVKARQPSRQPSPLHAHPEPVGRRSQCSHPDVGQGAVLRGIDLPLALVKARQPSPRCRAMGCYFL
jgi:hypothetical protein